MTVRMPKPEPPPPERSKAGVTFFKVKDKRREWNRKQALGCRTIEGGGGAFKTLKI
jgi:hypothetical protein